MFERVFRISEYAPGVPFTTAGHTITAARMPHYTVESYGFRVSANGSTLAYSGDSAPGRAPERSRPRRRPVRVRGDAFHR